MQGFIERLYPYTGDARTLTFLQSFVDYELENGLTPEGYAWSQVPYASANPARNDTPAGASLGRTTLSRMLLVRMGTAISALYEMTGNTKYLRAAIHCADALVKNYKPGDEDHSPWPVRLWARDGKSRRQAHGLISANVIEPSCCSMNSYAEAGRCCRLHASAAAAWDWFQKYPLANNVWVGYFEDTVPSMSNMNQVIPWSLPATSCFIRRKTRSGASMLNNLSSGSRPLPNAPSTWYTGLRSQPSRGMA